MNLQELIQQSEAYAEYYAQLSDVKEKEIFTQYILDMQKDKFLQIIEEHIEQAIDTEGQTHLEWLKEAVEKRI